MAPRVSRRRGTTSLINDTGAGGPGAVDASAALGLLGSEDHGRSVGAHRGYTLAVDSSTTRSKTPPWQSRDAEVVAIGRPFEGESAPLVGTGVLPEVLSQRGLVGERSLGRSGAATNAPAPGATIR